MDLIYHEVTHRAFAIKVLLVLMGWSTCCPRRTILSRAMGSGEVPAEVAVSVKPFPWPSVKFDPGAIAAAAAFNLLLVFAFLTPTRGQHCTQPYIACMVTQSESLLGMFTGCVISMAADNL